jgi:hypothetical protein
MGLEVTLTGCIHFTGGVDDDEDPQVRSCLLAGILLHTTVSPAVLMARESRRAANIRDRANEEVLEAYGSNGRVKARISGPAATARLLALSPRVSREQYRPIADSLRSQLLAKKAQAGKAFHGDRLLHLLDALAATSDSGYRANMKKIGVKPVRSRVTTRTGQTADRTVFWVAGRPRLSLTRIRTASPEPVDPTPARAGGPSALEATPTDCSWYDSEIDYTYVGECATQQEIDDAAASMVAMDSDVESENDAVNTALSSASDGAMCDYGYHLDESLECVEDEDETSPLRLATNTEVSAWKSIVSAANPIETPDGSESISELPVMKGTPTPPCMGAGLAFTGLGFVYLEKAAKLYAIVFAPAPPAEGLGAALFAAAGACIAVVGAGIVLTDCLHEH